MPRFDERPLQWTDVLGRFEEHSHQRHFRNAWALTGRLKDEGRDHWQVGSEQLARWNRGCDNLLGLMTGLGKRRDLEKQDLSTALREFIQEFEHHTERMYQMIYGEINDSENNEKLTEIFDWFNLVFRTSIYALVSGWIEDKQDHFTITTTINLTTGETTQERTGTEMTVPKKYRKATKRL